MTVKKYTYCAHTTGQNFHHHLSKMIFYDGIRYLLKVNFLNYQGSTPSKVLIYTMNCFKSLVVLCLFKLRALHRSTPYVRNFAKIQQYSSVRMLLLLGIGKLQGEPPVPYLQAVTQIPCVSDWQGSKQGVNHISLLFQLCTSIKFQPCSQILNVFHKFHFSMVDVNFK